MARAELPAVSWRVVEGEPADVLVRESRRSALLVMGSHSVEGLMHSALGSVADTCARMAECPMVIIPPTGRAATNPAEIATAKARSSRRPHLRLSTNLTGTSAPPGMRL